MQKERRIKHNRAKCLQCGDIIESVHRHDFKFCSCRKLAVDGGLDYIRRLGTPEEIEDLSEFYDE